MIGRNPEFVAFGPFRFVPGDGLWRHGRPVGLPPRALAVLTALLTSAGTLVSKQDLMEAASPDTFGIVLDWFSELAAHVRPS